MVRRAEEVSDSNQFQFSFADGAGFRDDDGGGGRGACRSPFAFAPPEEPAMRLKLAAVAALVSVSAGLAADGLTKGTVELKSVSALAFGPDGVLFIGDPTAGAIHAVGTGDTKPGAKDDVNVEKLNEKIASLLGGGTATVNDVKVNPASGTIYLAVTRTGRGGGPIILTCGRDGKLAELNLKDVPCATAKLPNPTDNAKQRQDAITSLAFVGGKVIVAGLSNEEFASTLRTIPFPFQTADKGTSVEIYHGAHGKLETNAPIRTFTPYKIGAADYLLAAYTCTPLVKLPVADLKPGTKVKGTTIAELGNMNRPLDMIVYTKDKKDYVLMSNSARGVMKLSADQFEAAGQIDEKRVPDKAGVKYETVADLKGVKQLDKLDDGRALVLIENDDKSLTLKSIPLP